MLSKQYNKSPLRYDNSLSKGHKIRYIWQEVLSSLSSDYLTGFLHPVHVFFPNLPYVSWNTYLWLKCKNMLFLPICNAFTIHNWVFCKTNCNTTIVLITAIYTLTLVQNRQYNVEFLSCCRCSGGNKYGYSVGPVNGSWIAQLINCLRLNPRKCNLALLLLQIPCHSSKEHLICNNKSGKSSSKRN